MSGRICGHCTHWRCDNFMHLIGYCTITRTKRFHGSMCDTCTKYQSMWGYTRPMTEEEKGGADNEKTDM